MHICVDGLGRPGLQSIICKDATPNRSHPRMIVTAKNRVPFLWMIFALLPWTAALFKYQVMSSCFTFSLMKFIENPAGLAFVLSLPSFLSLVVRPLVNFTADRIWTRWGRRKPFIIPSWLGVIGILTLMPLMPNFWALVACYMAYQVFNDFGDPIEQLKMEVVPPSQRGTSTAIGSWIANLSFMTFALIAVGRFNDYQFMAGVPITGEASLYWSAAIAMSAMLLLIMFGIKETNPHSALAGERFSFLGFFRGLTTKHLWPVYVLIFAWAIYQSGLGVLGTLLQVEQWGMTIQEMGINQAVGGTMNIFIIGTVIFFADRMDRMRWFLRMLVLSVVVNLSYYIYIEYILYDGTPHLVEIIFFGETLSIIGIFIGVMYTPLVYDFVDRNEMGTFQAGQSVIGRVTGIVTMNGIGIFAWTWATLLMPPGGDSVRVVLREVQDDGQVNARLDAGAWTDPVTGASRSASDVSAKAWYATNATLDYGRGFEVRLKNDDSVKLKERRDQLAGRKGPLEAKLANAKGLKEAERIASLEAEIAPLVKEIAEIDSELTRRSNVFRDQVLANLGDAVIRPGEQVLAAGEVPVAIFSVPLSGKPEHVGAALEKTLDRLRIARDETVDLRLNFRESDRTYRLMISQRLAADGDAQAAARVLASSLLTHAHENLRAVLGASPEPQLASRAVAVSLDLQIVEDPLNQHVSPIMRVANAIWGLVAEVPGPERRILALGRGMREPGTFDHTRVTTIPGEAAAIRVTALFQGAPPAGQADADLAAVDARLEGLLQGRPEAVVAARAVYRRVQQVGAEQRMTIARPVVGAGFKPLKYDYMAGYLWMFVLQVVACLILWNFMKKVKSGQIRRRGVEEMEATK